MRPFKSPHRETTTLLPPCIEDWLPEKHLARFVVEICEQLDLKEIYSKYSSKGASPYDPRMLLELLFYGYATGVFSSRKIETSTFDSVAFRYISGDLHPDHDTIANFRKSFLPQIQELFTQILLIANQMGFVKLGKVFIDGTKVKADASKHKAMSYEYMTKLEKRFKEEIDALLRKAEQTDRDEEPELDIPAEIKRRSDRLEKIKKAKKVLEEHAADRYEKEQKEYQEKVRQRTEKEKKTGKKPKGKPPRTPEKGVRPKDQYNFTDPDSKIMGSQKKGFDQCYNAQAAVTEDMLIVGGHANSNANDQNELLPTLDDIPEELGKPDVVVADTGYCNNENIEGSNKRNIDSYISTGRQPHNSGLETTADKMPDTSKAFKSDLNLIGQMKEKLKSANGKAIYRLRKMTVEPVFGIIKEIMGFRQFSLRGEEKVDGEWSLVCSAYNLKKIFVMANS